MARSSRACPPEGHGSGRRVERTTAICQKFVDGMGMREGGAAGSALRKGVRLINSE